MNELHGENPGNTTTNIECSTNDDAPERGHHHDFGFLLYNGVEQMGWQAGPGGGFPCLACVCFCSYVFPASAVALFLSIPAIAIRLQTIVS